MSPLSDGLLDYSHPFVLTARSVGALGEFSNGFSWVVAACLSRTMRAFPHMKCC